MFLVLGIPGVWPCGQDWRYPDWVRNLIAPVAIFKFTETIDFQNVSEEHRQSLFIELLIFIVFFTVQFFSSSVFSSSSSSSCSSSPSSSFYSSSVLRHPLHVPLHHFPLYSPPIAPRSPLTHPHYSEAFRGSSWPSQFSSASFSYKILFLLLLLTPLHMRIFLNQFVIPFPLCFPCCFPASLLDLVASSSLYHPPPYFFLFIFLNNIIPPLSSSSSSFFSSFSRRRNRKWDFLLLSMVSSVSFSSPAALLLSDVTLEPSPRQLLISLGQNGDSLTAGVTGHRSAP